MHTTGKLQCRFSLKPTYSARKLLYNANLPQLQQIKNRVKSNQTGIISNG